MADILGKCERKRELWGYEMSGRYNMLTESATPLLASDHNNNNCNSAYSKSNAVDHCLQHLALATRKVSWFLIARRLFLSYQSLQTRSHALFLIVNNDGLDYGVVISRRSGATRRGLLPAKSHQQSTSWIPGISGENRDECIIICRSSNSVGVRLEIETIITNFLEGSCNAIPASSPRTPYHVLRHERTLCFSLREE